MSEKLKPCPFCGGEAKLARHENPNYRRDTYGRHYVYSIDCMECAASAGNRYNEDVIVAAWNKRAKHAGEAREPVAWHIGNADGSINKIGAVYIRRSLAEKHIASYAEGELDASIVPLYAAPQPAAVPDGFVLVPKEPTPAMSAAGFSVSEAEHDPAGVYRAMIAAAPQPRE